MYGNAIIHNRTMSELSKKSRRKCRCGCNNRATHIGMANYIALTLGCEFYIRLWVRDGIAANARMRALKKPNQ